MRKYNTTEGKFKVIFEPNSMWTVRCESGIVCKIPKPFPYTDQHERYVQELDENKANALLIADAGNTIQLCDKLPSKLWEENQELLEFVKSIGSNYVTLHEKANELINKIQNG